MKHSIKRHLVLVCGTSPQIITETLFGLFQQEKENFIPTHVHVITTKTGGERAELSLLHSKSGQFHKLVKSYALKEKVSFSTKDIHVITNQNKPLSDIQSPEDNEAAADFIASFIQKLSSDESACICASLAGGRKTMGFYLGYAMSIFGREQDRLTHVLVSPQYENNPDFFFPTKQSHIIYAYGDKNKPLDTQKGEVTLADIPFVRLRNELPAESISMNQSFKEIVSLIQHNKKPHKLVIHLAQKKIIASGIEIAMPPSEMAFYCWLAYRQQQQQSAVAAPYEGEPNINHAKEFSAIYQQIVGEMADTDRTLNSLKPGMEKKYFEEKNSRVNRILKRKLGNDLAHNYSIHRQGIRGRSTYSLKLLPSQINFT